MTNHRGVANVFIQPAEVKPKYAKQRIVLAHRSQRPLPLRNTYPLKLVARPAERVQVMLPAQGFWIVQVEYPSISVERAAMKRDKARQEIHRHQIEIHLQPRHQTQLQ